MVNDKSLLVPLTIKWNTINHTVGSLGSKTNRTPWTEATAGTAGLGRAVLWFFLAGGDETHTLSVWACPSFHFIRMSETRSPISYNVLENGDIRLFDVAQSLA